MRKTRLFTVVFFMLLSSNIDAVSNDQKTDSGVKVKQERITGITISSYIKEIWQDICLGALERNSKLLLGKSQEDFVKFLEFIEKNAKKAKTQFIESEMSFFQIKIDKLIKLGLIGNCSKIDQNDLYLQSRCDKKSEHAIWSFSAVLYLDWWRYVIENDLALSQNQNIELIKAAEINNNRIKNLEGGFNSSIFMKNKNKIDLYLKDLKQQGIINRCVDFSQPLLKRIEYTCEVISTSQISASKLPYMFKITKH